MSECASCERLKAVITRWEERYERLALAKIEMATPAAVPVVVPEVKPPTAIEDAIEAVAEQSPNPTETRKALNRYVARMTARQEKDETIVAGIMRGGDEAPRDDD